VLDNRILFRQPPDRAKPDIEWLSDVKEIKMPVLLAFGDADAYARLMLTILFKTVGRR
jgi:hypothetical protein